MTLVEGPQSSLLGTWSGPVLFSCGFPVNPLPVSDQVWFMYSLTCPGWAVTTFPAVAGSPNLRSALDIFGITNHMTSHEWPSSTLHAVARLQGHLGVRLPSHSRPTGTPASRWSTFYSPFGKSGDIWSSFASILVRVYIKGRERLTLNLDSSNLQLQGELWRVHSYAHLVPECQSWCPCTVLQAV